jgi:hypothetical protein
MNGDYSEIPEVIEREAQELSKSPDGRLFESSRVILGQIHSQLDCTPRPS